MATLVQQLVQQAKLTFRKDKNVLTEDLDKLRTIMSQLTTKDFNIQPGITDKSWDFPPYIRDAPAAFMDVYECSQFSITIFMLKSNRVMPLHDHPQMYGLMKTLSGSMSVTSYNRPKVTKGTSPPYLSYLMGTILATPSSEPCCFNPEQGNIHEIQAQDSHVIFIDILAPPYNPEQGRDCTYYTKESPPPSPPPSTKTDIISTTTTTTTRSSSSNGQTPQKSVWLVPGTHPSWFSCVPQPYAGPKVQ